MNTTSEKIYAAIGLIVIPPVIASFVFLKDETTISVQSCETVRGRRGDSERIVTVEGERLQLLPAWLGGPERDYAMRRLCEDGAARVTIRGARLRALGFWQRIIFAVD